jgi:hypothetical protein
MGLKDYLWYACSNAKEKFGEALYRTENNIIQEHPRFTKAFDVVVGAPFKAMGYLCKDAKYIRAPFIKTRIGMIGLAVWTASMGDFIVRDENSIPMQIYNKTISTAQNIRDNIQRSLETKVDIDGDGRPDIKIYGIVDKVEKINR